jgi:hypothetical protein
MATMSLPRGAPSRMVEAMIKKLTGERDQVKSMIKEEVEKLMQLGAEVTGITYNCSSSSARRTCITPRNMRTSYCQDGSDLNMKRMHWIFHQLPVGTLRTFLCREENMQTTKADECKVGTQKGGRNDLSQELH